MKKATLILIIVLLVGVLGYEIYMYTKDMEVVTNGNIIGNTAENNIPANTSIVLDEKTLDLHGTFKENDLIFNNEKITVEGYSKEIEIVQVSGLKDKSVEDKINKNIKERVIKYLRDNNKDNGDKIINSKVIANFSNVLSIGLGVNVKNLAGFHKDCMMMGLNYNLKNGEILEFKDFFKQNEDITSIVRMLLYSGLLYNQRDMNLFEGEGFEEPYYDAEKGGWYARYKEFDSDGRAAINEIRPYVLPIDEYEIEKYSKKFLMDENKNFCFSPSRLVIIIDNKGYQINFKDIANKVVIYDKYLTEDSLYENDNIGAKSVITCSEEINYGIYKDAKYESENFFYDICVDDTNNLNSQNPLNITAEQKELLINQLKDRVNKYKDEASKNPNKAYFIFDNLCYYRDYTEESVFDNSLGYYTPKKTYTNKMITELKEKVVICDISDKDKCLEQILNRYRYYNLKMHGTIVDMIDNYSEFHGLVFDFPITEYEEENKYDIDNVSTSNVDSKNSELLPSSTRKIEKSEIQDWNKDKLYLAYNEIFARHGHDFKTQEYKEYFNSQSWYNAIPGKTVSMEELSEIEKYNVSLIKSIADEK